MLTRTSDLWAFGNNEHGQLGLTKCDSKSLPERVALFDQLDAKIVSISAGDQHTLYLTSDGDVIGTGMNQYGQCGFNALECQETDQPYKMLSLKQVV